MNDDTPAPAAAQWCTDCNSAHVPDGSCPVVPPGSEHDLTRATEPGVRGRVVGEIVRHTTWVDDKNHVWCTCGWEIECPNYQIAMIMGEWHKEVERTCGES